MKNIHLLLAGESYLSLNCSYRDSAIGTEVRKPYWTYTKDWKHYMSVTDASVRPHNIYITSNSKFVRDEYITDGIEVIKATPKLVDAQGLVDRREWKKIILTTDQDLIKDGVQEIPDEFLEWFVKNPSCESVDIETIMECEKCGKEHCDNLQCRGYKDIPYYKIIISKEELKTSEEWQKQFPNTKVIDPDGWDRKNYQYSWFEEKITLIEYTSRLYRSTVKGIIPKKETKQDLPIVNGSYGCIIQTKKQEPKQETLEEVAERLYSGVYRQFERMLFIKGAKWQQEQILDFLYSEITERRDYSASKMCEKVIEFIEQFKNK